jgi:ABC-type spermidine/putrescine transport system permease subunit I
MVDEALTKIPTPKPASRPPKEKPGPLEYMRRWPLQVIVTATLLFLYLPLLTLMAFSFNDSRRNIVWQGFTLDWYAKAFNNASLSEAFFNSLTIAFFCTIFSVILGALAAVMLWQAGNARTRVVSLAPRSPHHTPVGRSQGSPCAALDRAASERVRGKIGRAHV